MPTRTRALMLAAVIVVISPQASGASPMTDFLDRIRGCRKLVRYGPSLQLWPYTEKPYRKRAL